MIPREALRRAVLVTVVRAVAGIVIVSAFAVLIVLAVAGALDRCAVAFE